MRNLVSPELPVRDLGALNHRQEAQLMQGIHTLLGEGTPALQFPREIEALIMRQAIQHDLQLSSAFPLRCSQDVRKIWPFIVDL